MLKDAVLKKLYNEEIFTKGYLKSLGFSSG